MFNPFYGGFPFGFADKKKFKRMKNILRNIFKRHYSIRCHETQKYEEEFLSMALKETTKHLRDLLSHITHDLEKADGGNKAASQRVRTATVKLEKVAKLYRKESIKAEKGTSKTTARKTTSSKKTASKSKSRPVAKASHSKAKPKAKAHRANPRAMSFKRPSAKLPVRHVFR
jgi:hypothetical protein